MGEDGGAILDGAIGSVSEVSGVEPRVSVGADDDCNSSSESLSYKELKGWLRFILVLLGV